MTSLLTASVSLPGRMVDATIVGHADERTWTVDADPVNPPSPHARSAKGGTPVSLGLAVHAIRSGPSRLLHAAARHSW
jgi:hypothetical protein